MRWAGSAEGRGIVCYGDILAVTADRKWLSFMRSYLNFIQLSARLVKNIRQALIPFSFDRIYGHYFDRIISENAKLVLEKSITHYLAAIDRRHTRLRLSDANTRKDNNRHP